MLRIKALFILLLWTIYLPANGRTENLFSKNSVTFFLDTLVVPGGNNIQIPILVNQFTNISSFQFSLHWNPAILDFLSTSDYLLPELADANFGINDAESGILTVLWFTSDLSAISLEDNVPMFSLNFTVIGDCGSDTSIHFSNSPTPQIVLEVDGPEIIFRDAIFQEGILEISCPPDINETILTPTSCFGNSDGAIHITISEGIPPYTLLWNTGAQTMNLTDIPSGQYQVTITDAIGQTSVSDSFEILSPLPIITNLVADVGCGGNTGLASVLPQNGLPPYRIFWSTGDTSNTILGLSAGYYMVSIMDDTGCTTIDTAIVEDIEPIIIDCEVGHVTCFGQNDGYIDIEVTGGLFPYTYLWSNNAHLEDLTNLGQGEYILTLGTSGNCILTKVVTVREPAALDIELDITPALDGDGWDVRLIPQGGLSPYTITWSTGENDWATRNLPTGSYAVTLEDSNGCSKIDTFEINITQTISKPEMVNFNLSPNPATNIINVLITFSNPTDAVLEIYSFNGNLVMRKKIYSNRFEDQISLSDWANGIYLVQITTPFSVSMKKILVKK